jgi:acyl-CoA reductase-like NAD-dependent aldehyde dehydrogenase
MMVVCLSVSNSAAGSRIYIHENIYDEFVKRAVERARKRKVGNPFDASSQQGAQVSKEQFDKVMGYIKSARDEGATLQLGGHRVGDKVYLCACIHPLFFHLSSCMMHNIPIGLLYRTNRIQ